VVFIIGLTTSVVALSLGDSKEDSPAYKEAKAFVKAIDFVNEYAVLNQQVLGMFIRPVDTEDLSVSRWCYHWLRFRDNAWSGMPEETLSEEHCLEDGVQWELKLEGKTYIYDPELEIQPPVVIFSPSGETTPIEVAIFEHRTASVSTAETQRIEIDMMGNNHWLNQEEEEKRRER
jgi:general secretion pathway protein H